MQAVNSEAQQILTDLSDIVVAGGAESMSTAPYYVNGVRFTKLIHELERTGKRYGLVTLCIAGGMGISTIVENTQI